MPTLVERPMAIEVPGGKQILEHVGHVATGDAGVSVAHMRSPAGWSEPAQRPEFREITLVLAGAVHVEHDGGTLVVHAGQSVITEPGERIRYTTPAGAEYVAVCLPAFSPDTVHREG
ncbi:MAG: cupin domain-containing protein [Alphaproteobacteria bacterium]|nr:cupin domain-containing protein [Alphaproteobacteria bacterium]